MTLVQTFFGVPQGIQGKVVILGIPFDRNTSCRLGSSKLPDLSREASKYLEEYSFIQRIDIREANISDFGNIPVTHNFEETLKNIQETIESLRNKKLVFVGGDHSITLGTMRALSKYVRKFVVLDAHADLYPSYNNNVYSHASVLRRILEFIDPSRVIIVGLRTLARVEEEYIEENGIDYYTTREISEDPSLLEDVLATADYISIDLDVFDISYIPDVSCPEPFGLDPNLLNSIFRASRLRAKFVDIVEGVPESPFSQSAIYTATFVRELSLILSLT